MGAEGRHNGPAVREAGGMKDFWGSHQANRLACGWMSRAVKPFTVCSTLTESGIRGSKNRTSPLTLQGRGVKVNEGHQGEQEERRSRERSPDTDDVSIRLLLQMSFDHPGSVFPVGHHPAEGHTTETADKTNHAKRTGCCGSKNNVKELLVLSARWTKLLNLTWK